jgi:hypothetical protein
MDRQVTRHRYVSRLRLTGECNRFRVIQQVNCLHPQPVLASKTDIKSDQKYQACPGYLTRFPVSVGWELSSYVDTQLKSLVV